MADAIDRAMAVVDHDAYVTDGGTVLPQSSSPAIIAQVLRLLDVRRRMRVFEVGTGSGYSTALLCHLVGPTGRVDSMDIDPALVHRAAARLKGSGLTQVQLTVGDASAISPEGSPYDRLVAWATADLLLGGWVASVPQGRIVAPLRLLPIEGATTVVRVVVENGSPVVEGFSPGGFVPLTAAPVADFEGLRRERADVVVESALGHLLLSAPWVRAAPADLRQRLAAHGVDLIPRPTPLREGESPDDLWWYLVAANPEGLTAGTLVPGGAAFGCGDPDGLVLVKRGAVEGGVGCVTAGQPDRCLDRFAAWIAAWRSAGKPGLSRLRGVMDRLDGAGWRVGVRT